DDRSGVRQTGFPEQLCALERFVARHRGRAPRNQLESTAGPSRLPHLSARNRSAGTRRSGQTSLPRSTAGQPRPGRVAEIRGVCDGGAGNRLHVLHAGLFLQTPRDGKSVAMSDGKKPVRWLKIAAAIAAVALAAQSVRLFVPAVSHANAANPLSPTPLTP